MIRKFSQLLVICLLSSPIRSFLFKNYANSFHTGIVASEFTQFSGIRALNLDGNTETPKPHKGVEIPKLNGSDVRVGIIMTRWNPNIVQGLLQGVNESLVEAGVKPTNIFTTYVPGAFEIPVVAKYLCASKRFDVIICLGCLIKGETMHFEYIAQSTASGIMQVSLDSMIPCVFGVLTVLNLEQAIKRSSGTTNEGRSWAKTAVEMGLARMSALGLNKEKEGSQATYVTFKPNIDVAKKDESGSQASKIPKKFGF